MDNDGEKDIGNKFERQRYCFCMRYAAISDNYLLIIVDVIKHLHFSSTVVVKYHIISTIYYWNYDILLLYQVSNIAARYRRFSALQLAKPLLNEIIIGKVYV